MDLDVSRLRRGEWIVAVSALVLALDLFALSWYGLNAVLAPTAARLGGSTSVSGWNALTNLRWLVLLTIVVGAALVYFQASRRAPAIPVSLSVILTVLASLTALALIYRVAINLPGPDSLLERKAGAWIGLIAALALLYGGFQSLRREGIRAEDGPGEIEPVNLGSTARSS